LNEQKALLPGQLTELATKERLELDERLRDLACGILAQEEAKRLEVRFGKLLVDSSLTPDQAAERITKLHGPLAGFLVRNEFTPEFGGLPRLGKLKPVATAVGGLSKFFKAGSAAKGLLITSRVLGIVGAGLGIAIDVWEAIAENHREKQASRARDEVRNWFNEQASDLENHFEGTTTRFLDEWIAGDLEATEAQLSQLRKQRTDNSSFFDELHGLSITTN
jgi:hypothetical protein